MSPSAISARKNVLPEAASPGVFLLIARQLKSPLVYILIVAAGLSFVVGDVFDTSIILLVVAINTLLGYLQESKASQALQELRRLVQPQTRVRRDGLLMTIDARDVRLGDCMVLETGDRISADGQLTLVNDLQINESTLSGESMPVTKDLTEATAVFMGTTVVAGRGEALVTAIGSSTRLGKTAELVASLEDEQTPLQQQLQKLANVLSLAVLFTGVAVLVVGVVKGEPVVEMLALSAALAVAAIPEGLLVGVTVILAVGMQRILRKKALVRHLLAAETLGSVSVICTDKTGTITQGDMQLTETVSTERTMAQTIAVLCGNASMDGATIRGSITEAALLSGVLQEGIAMDALLAAHPRLDELPFSSTNKYMATLHRFGKNHAVLMKGAPEVVERFCTSGGRVLEEAAKKMAAKGLRVIAVAMKEVSPHVAALVGEELGGLRFVGLFGLSDPLRPEAAQTIADAKRAGVRTIIITGDHPDTARAIATQAGFVLRADNVLTGAELEAMTEKDFEKRLATIDVYARVLPPQKVRIVQAWKRRGASIAMIGDGVNDAPALKAADIGVALGSGTEAAKQSSDMVLLDNNVATLVHAIREGRVIFDNIRKMTIYLLTDCFTEIVLILGAFVMGWPIPLLPAQILWINLVTDGFPHLALTLEPEEEGIMKRPPRQRGESVLQRETMRLVVLIGATTDIILLLLYGYMIHLGYDLAFARTFIFAALGINSLLYVFSVRNLRESIFHVNPFKNSALNGAVILGSLCLLAPLLLPPLREVFGFVALRLTDYLFLLFLGIGKLLFVEYVKLHWRKHYVA